MVRKPDTRTAMGQLIADIRAAIPVADPQVCTGQCDGCSLKLIEFLAGELADWERRLAAGEQPRLGDLSALARTARKVHAVLQRNGVVGPLA